MGEPHTSISTSSGLSICSQNYNELSAGVCSAEVCFVRLTVVHIVLTMKEIMIELQILTTVVQMKWGMGHYSH